jgi:hypothetical protein
MFRSKFKFALLLLFCVLFTLGLSISTQSLFAAILSTWGKSASIGSTNIKLEESTENLVYGVIDATSKEGSFMLFEKGYGDERFRVDQNGNVEAAGTVTASGQAVCLADGTNCPAVTGDNLGNHTATANLNINNNEVDNINYLDIRADKGYGLRFWSSDSYAINMGDSDEYHYGSVTGYSIKMNMNDQNDRGWTWGKDGQAPIAAINTQGNMQLAGETRSSWVHATAAGDNTFAGNILFTGQGKIISSGSESTYGALSVQGIKNNWGGINFRNGAGGNLGTLMVHADHQGFYNDSDNAWDWYWTNGTLTAGSVPWSRISGFPAACSSGQFVTGVGATLACASASGADNLGNHDATEHLNMADFQVQSARALQLKDWDDDTGGTDDKYRLLARDGAFQFYNGGVVVGSYADGTWTDLSDGTLIVEGNAGIGTVSPGAKLEVAGQVKITGGSPGAGKVLTSDASGLASWTTPSSPVEVDGVIGNEVKNAADSTLTRTGAGTAADPYLLGLNLGNANAWTANQRFTANVIAQGEINHQNDDFLYINSYGGIQLRLNSDGSGAQGFNINNNANTTVFTVANTSGNVGIGTNNPQAPLHIRTGIGEKLRLQGEGVGVANIAHIAFYDSNGIQVGAIGDNNNSNNDIIVRADAGKVRLNVNNGAYEVTLSDNGNFGIGVANPGAKLEVAGQVKITGGSPGAGKILTSDASGLASWEALTGVQSLAVNGYQSLPGGLYIQWGRAVSTVDDSESFTFPTAFPNACFNVQTTITTAGAQWQLPVTSRSTTGFTVDRENDVNGDRPFYWFTVGY